MQELAKKSKAASRELMALTPEVKTKIFNELIANLKAAKDDINSQNQIDLFQAKKAGLPAAMIDRLDLSHERLDQVIAGVEQIRDQPEVVGSFFEEFENEIGLKIKKQRIPLGVILMIFESRPNVVVDCAALAIKSSNAIILKGGKEAKNTNEILGHIIRNSIRKYIPEDSVTVLASDDRQCVNDLLSLNEEIDVVIPRGGHGLIDYVSNNTKIPVIAHYKGLCHMYIDKFADKKKAIDLIENAKTQRPGVCNAVETLLIHKDILPEIAKDLNDRLKSKGTELRVDDAFSEATSSGVMLKATEDDWKTEYLDNILAIKTVGTLDDAIKHISSYGSNHSESIVSEDSTRCSKFLNSVDASCVMINASTRFNDGGQLGLGAELGISTTKLHAYGPMGVEQMTTSRYVVVGDGQVRS